MTTNLWEYKDPKDQPARLKGLDLETDPVRGFPALHDDARLVLRFIGEFCRDNNLPAPIVCEIGRIAEDQEALYYETELQRIKGVVQNGEAEKLARRLARDRKSLHRVDDNREGKSRAFDIRSWTFTELQRSKIKRAVLAQFPGIEALHHRVVGDAWHFHFGVPSAQKKR